LIIVQQLAAVVWVATSAFVYDFAEDEDVFEAEGVVGAAEVVACSTTVSSVATGAGAFDACGIKITNATITTTMILRVTAIFFI
jgi:hypothetical protein